MYARLELLLDEYSLQVVVPKDSPAFHWTPTYWKTKRLEWMQRSEGAQIVLHHGGALSEPQPKDSPVQLIYVFPGATERGRGQERPDMRHRNWAKALIDHDVLDTPLPDKMQEAEPTKYTAPLLQRVLDFVKRSGGEVSIPSVLRMFGKELAPGLNQNNAAQQRTRFLAWVLEFRHDLTVDNSKDIVYLVQPKSTARPVATPATAAVLKQQSERSFDWLHNTQWKEKDFHAVYTIMRQKPGKKGLFVVTKSCVGQQTYDIAIHVDEGGLLHYGDKKKWCLTSCDDAELIWADSQTGNRPYVWNRFRSEPKGAGKGKQAAAKADHWASDDPKAPWPQLPGPIGAKPKTAEITKAPAAQAGADPWLQNDPWKPAQVQKQTQVATPAVAPHRTAAGPKAAAAQAPRQTSAPAAEGPKDPSTPPPKASAAQAGPDPWDSGDPWMQ
ncbi:unnamed protein product, partial [Symbiodinium sp. CCMP2592]